jgi:hypothetical protein
VTAREWHFRARLARNGSEFIAWCARTPELRNGPLEVDLSEEVYFEFGSTAEEAIAKLKREVLQ